MVPIASRVPADRPVRRLARPLSIVLLYALAFAVVQQIGLALVAEPVDVALFWPAAGLAVGTFAVAAPRLVPWLAAVQCALNVLGNVLYGNGWTVAVVFGVANLLAPLVIALVVRGAQSTRRSLRTMTSHELLVLLGLSWLAALVASLLGALSLSAVRGADEMLLVWRGWWAADAAGTAAVAPLVIAVVTGRWRIVSGRLLEFALSAATVLAAVLLGFWEAEPFGLTGLRIVVLVALLWPAMRFGLFGLSAVLAPTVTAVVVLTRAGHGPFGAADRSFDAVFDAQVYVLGISLAALVIAAGSDTIRRGSAAIAAREGLRRSALRTARINVLATQLAGAVTRRHIARVVHDSAADVVGATSASLAVVEAEIATFFPEASLTGRVLPIDRPGPATEALRRRELVLVRDRDQLARLYPSHVADAERLGMHAIACVPLQRIGAPAPAGAVVLMWDQPQEFDPDVRGALLLVGELVTQAVTRAELFETERNLRRRAEGLEAVAAALARAVTVVDVATTIVEVGLGAVSSVGVVTRPVGDHLELLAPTAPEVRPFVQAYDGLALTARTPITAAVRTGRTISVASVGEMRDLYPDGVERMEGLGLKRMVAAPIMVAGRIAGSIAAGASIEPQPGDDLVAYVEALAELAGHAMDRAQRYEAQHEIADVLQRSMLTAVPDRSDVLLAAHYSPSVEPLEVGGDWFDAIEGPHGDVVLVLGDVVGRGLEAATTMGQLRSAARALGVTLDSPCAVLGGLDDFADQTPAALCATVVCAHLEPVSGRLRYAVAGHPPPLLLGIDGRARFLDGGHRAPLGIRGQCEEEGRVTIAAGERLVLYSDGLVERRGDSIDIGLELLRQAAESSRALHGEEFIAAILDRLGDLGGQDDDACLLVAERTRVTSRLDVVVHRPDELAAMRIAVVEWLRQLDCDGVPFDRRGLDDLVLALDELCANGLEHGLGHGHDGGVAVSLLFDGIETVTARVRDPGTWVVPDARGGGGRGLSIVRAVTDRLSIEQRDGTTAVLHKRLPLAERRDGSA